ncbi:hypothetical protein [Streptomyces sp. NPDC001828]|uniref:hypothetical protein n=1 Tax=Streptomyces sp. NPDC001828 TaxID=3364615 RepID=UPI00367E9B42
MTLVQASHGQLAQPVNRSPVTADSLLQYGPRPRELTYRRIGEGLRRGGPVMIVVADAQAVPAEALRYLAGLKGPSAERVPLVLTGSPSFMTAVDRIPAALSRRLHA